MNIAVVDDEKVIREQIKKLIENRQTGYTIDAYSTGEDLLKAKKHYNMVFLDIQMDGINGIDTAKKIREKDEDTILIFITGIKEYVFDAFDVSAFHYLLKPIEEKKLVSVYECAVSEVEKQKQQREKALFIKTRTRNVMLNQNRILYIESRAKKAEIHTMDETIEIYAALSELEEQLADSFYRCHRGYLVNMAFITEYDRGNITLNNGETLILAKEKYSEFVKVYMRYLRNGGIFCV